MTMPPDAAAWIRAHAWTKGMRKEYGDVPGFYDACACEYGASHGCQIGQCDRCHRGAALHAYETAICTRGGKYPVFFRERYAHPTEHAVGPRREQVAMVWLADRRCRWQCPHTCHAAPAPVTPVQLGLFEEATP